MPSSTRKAPRARRGAPSLPAWRWLLYAAIGAAVFVFVYWGSGGSLTTDPQRIDLNPASRDAGFFGLLFGGLSLAAARLLVDPVFIGLSQRRSRMALAGELAVEVLKTGADIAAGVVIDAAIGGASGGSSPSKAGSGSPGGGGRSGGGGASGRF